MNINKPRLKTRDKPPEEEPRLYKRTNYKPVALLMVLVVVFPL
jgi:hypothetical protein